MRAQIAQPAFVPIDFLPDARQLLLDVEDVLELPGPGRQELDEARLESPGVPHARGDIGELLAHVFRVYVHGLELAEAGEPAQAVVEPVGRDLDLDARRPELAAAGLHARVGHIPSDAAGQEAYLGDRTVERVHLDAGLASADHHARWHARSREGWGPVRGGRDLRSREAGRDADGRSRARDPLGGDRVPRVARDLAVER